jgi:SAM-dependent methyltransferase
MEMNRSKMHEVLARQTADDVVRAQFIIGLKRQLRAIAKGNETTYSRFVEPRFRGRHGRNPATIEEVDAEMVREPYYRLWSALTRTAQDMMWDAVETTVQRDMPRMLEAASRLTRRGDARGSLSLDPDFAAPADVLVADIHCQPGGYMRNAGETDITAGALYESGGNLYASGVGNGLRDSKAGAVIGWLAQSQPEFRPLRILDLGCSAGGASVVYAASFPEAEIHAVDAGPAILRYAHARAEALGVTVHFHQMDVTRLKFADASFDLVVSHNLMHEISRATLAGMFAESRRLLRPGGMAVHQDVPIRGERSLFERYMFAWETRYNNEPFWEIFAATDVPHLLAEAGFAPGSIAETQLRRIDGPGTWYVAQARKSAQT